MNAPLAQYFQDHYEVGNQLMGKSLFPAAVAYTPLGNVKNI